MNEPGPWGSLWEWLKLILVFASVIVLAFVTTRFLGTRFHGVGAGRHLRVVESLSLGQRRSICLVEAGDRVLVVGVTDQQITLLGTLEGNDADAIRVEWATGEGGKDAFPFLLGRKLADLRVKNREGTPPSGREAGDGQ